MAAQTPCCLKNVLNVKLKDSSLFTGQTKEKPNFMTSLSLKKKVTITRVFGQEYFFRLRTHFFFKFDARGLKDHAVAKELEKILLLVTLFSKLIF